MKKVNLQKLKLNKEIISKLGQSQVIGGNTVLAITCGDCLTARCLTKTQCPSLYCGPQTISLNCENTYHCETIDLP